MLLFILLLATPHVLALPQLGLGLGATIEVATSIFVGVPASLSTLVPQSALRSSYASANRSSALNGISTLLQLTSVIPTTTALNSRNATATVSTSISVTPPSASLPLSVFAVPLVSGLAPSSAGAPSSLPLFTTPLVMGASGFTTPTGLPTPAISLTLSSGVTASESIITLPTVYAPASISQSAPDLAPIPTTSGPQLNSSLPDLSAGQRGLGSILVTPSATMLSLPALPGPMITSTALSDGLFPNLSLPPISVTTTTVSGIASTQSVIQLTSSTTVAVTDTAALAGLATLLANSGVSGLSNFASLPSTPSATLPDIASLVSTPALPSVTTPSVAQAPESIGDEVRSDLAKGLGEIFRMLATQAEAAAIPTDTAINTSVPRMSASITYIPTPSTAIPTIGLPIVAEPARLPTVTGPTAAPATSLLASPSAIFNRALPLPLPPIPALPGIDSLTSASVSTTLAGISGSTPAVPDLFNASAFAPPSASSNPLAPVASIVGSLPIVGSGAPTNNLSSIVLSTVNNIPIPSDFPAIIQGVKNAAVANITSVVTSLPLIGQANQVLVILQLLGMMNLGDFGSLTTLTSIPAVQSALRVISTPDLATVVNVLENGSIVQSTVADGLLGNVVTFVQMVEELVPVVNNIRAVVAYLICDGLGLTSLSSVMDGSAVTKIF